MHIKIEKKVLETHLMKINKALSPNPALMSLKGIKFEVKDNTITTIASDGILSIKETIKNNGEISILKEGTILIPGKTFIEIVKKQDGVVEMEVINNKLKIYSNKMNVDVNLLEVEDYPNIDFDLFGEELIIDAEEMRKAIKEVSFASAENSKRIILNGVNFVAKNGFLRISATDSHRLATKKIKTTSENDFNITILAKNIKEFIPASIDGEVKIKVDENKINLEHDTTTIQSRLIDGIYPELSNLIPKEYNHTLKIDVKELGKLIDKSIVITSSDVKTIKLKITDGKLSFNSKQEELGVSHVTSDEFEWQGENEFEIVFDSKFLKDSIRNFEGKISIKFINSLKPFIVIGESNRTLVQLILPHRGY